jgi:hypothetical protein
MWIGIPDYSYITKHRLQIPSSVIFSVKFFVTFKKWFGLKKYDKLIGVGTAQLVNLSGVSCVRFYNIHTFLSRDGLYMENAKAVLYDRLTNCAIDETFIVIPLFTRSIELGPFTLWEKTNGSND